MTLEKPKPLGWNEEELLTSAQMNQLQLELVKALDGVGGGEYALQEDLVLDGPGKLIILGELEVNADGSVTIKTGATLSVAGDLDVESGGDFTLKDGAQLHFNNGSTGTITGTAQLTVLGSGTIRVGLVTPGLLLIADAGELRVAAGGVLNLEGAGHVTGILNVDGPSGKIEVEDDGVIEVKSGGQITAAAGATITVDKVDDLVVDDDVVNFRLNLAPSVITQNGTPGIPDWTARHDGAFVAHAVGVGNACILFPLPFRPGESLVVLLVYMKGAYGVGHGGFVPADTTLLELLEIDGTTGAVTVVSSLSDPGSGYDVAHPVTFTASLPYLIVGNKRLVLRLTAEGGSHSVADTTAVLGAEGTLIARGYRAQNEFY